MIIAFDRCHISPSFQVLADAEIEPAEFFSRCCHMSRDKFEPFAGGVSEVARKKNNPHYCDHCTKVFCEAEYDGDELARK